MAINLDVNNGFTTIEDNNSKTIKRKTCRYSNLSLFSITFHPMTASRLRPRRALFVQSHCQGRHDNAFDTTCLIAFQRYRGPRLHHLQRDLGEMHLLSPRAEPFRGSPPLPLLHLKTRKAMIISRLGENSNTMSQVLTEHGSLNFNSTLAAMR